MKSGIFSVIGLAVIVGCIGCKSGNGFDILLDVNPLKRPMGQIRIQPVPEEASRVARTQDIELHFSVKRDNGASGNEDITLDLRVPGGPAPEPAEKKEFGNRIQEKPELLPVPSLLTSQG